MEAANIHPPLRQSWPRPQQPRPIVLIGAGGIVNDAHLPAYALAQLPVHGVFDLREEQRRHTAAGFQIPRVYATLDEALAERNVVFDVAVPPEALLGIVERMPDDSVALLQKPLGTNLENARRIVGVCRKKHITAAVNFQLRFSPMMLALRDLIDRGLLGPIVDVDVHLNYREPWELFPFLQTQPRVEMLIASIHYFDWIRSILGEPAGVYARSIPHRKFPGLEATRTSAILDYGAHTRCNLSLNNTWGHGRQHERCEIRVEGMLGAALVQLGCLINFPRGEADRLQFTTGGGVWQEITLEGNWFPHAFRGTMANLQRFAAGEDDRLHTSVEDSLHTMALVEALYTSSRAGGTPIPGVEEDS